MRLFVFLYLRIIRFSLLDIFMQKRSYTTGIEISDRQWQRLASLLPEPPRSDQGGQVPAPNRACFEGLLWLLRSGARYKDIPKHFPSGSTCWRRLKWWHEQAIPGISAMGAITLLSRIGDIRAFLAFESSVSVMFEIGLTFPFREQLPRFE